MKLYKGKHTLTFDDFKFETINKFIPPDELVEKFPYLAEICLAFVVLHLRRKQGKEQKWLLGWITEQEIIVGFEDYGSFEKCEDFIHFYTAFDAPYFQYNIGCYDPLVTICNQGFFSDKPEIKWIVQQAYPLFYVEGTKKKGFEFEVDPMNFIDLDKVMKKAGFDYFEIHDVLAYFMSKAFCKTKLYDHTRWLQRRDWEFRD